MKFKEQNNRALHKVPHRKRKVALRRSRLSVCAGITCISLLFILLSNNLLAQDSSREILQSFKEKMEKVDNYSVEALIKVEVDFIKIKDRKAKVTFTKPNHYDFKAEGLALLPKKGMEMEYMEIIDQCFTSIFIQEETVQGINTSLIKVIPDNSEADIILAEMWIDPVTSILHKMRTYSKDSGSYTISFFYANHPFDLPDKIVVEFDVKNNKLPMSFTGDFEALEKVDKKGNSKGRVIIQYSNYQVKGE
jgi:hypothetical protein